MVRRARASLRRGLVLAGAAAVLLSIGAGSAAASTISGGANDPAFTGLPGETNNLRVTQTGNVTKFDDDVAVAVVGPPGGCVADANNDVICTPAVNTTVNNITIDLGAGDDSTTFTNVTVDVAQAGGLGNDKLRPTAGDLGSAGGAGNDELDASTGANADSTLDGDADNDILRATAAPASGYVQMDGGTGSDTFTGGLSYDLVYYDSRTNAVTVTADDVTNDGESGENDNVGSTIDAIFGGAGNDSLTGNALGNGLYGRGGNDILHGAGGDDGEILGEAGNDQVFGDAGQDSLSGGSGDDTIDGGAGDDYVGGDSGKDDVRGGEGIDSTYVSATNPNPPNNQLDISVTLDDVANDGAAGAGENIRSDIEDVDTDSGNDTIVGNAAFQVLSGGSGNDTIDGAAGNDFLYGESGNDTLKARDGFADRVDCGTGSDSAVVDTLDIVGASCETVDRADAGNANDTPEDRAPTVAFTSPAEGAKLPGAPVAVTIDAADDRGIARVILLDDGRTVGTDSAAPYAIVYSPTGADIGKNTLVAIAVDTSEQTASAVRTVNIGKFAPRSVTEKVTPARDRRSPYVFTAKGSVLLPAGVPRAQGCSAGTVTVSAKRGARTIAKRSVKLKKDCSYSVALRVRGRGRTAIRAAFGGNDVLSARSSATRNVRAG